jgi:hypothetical protein
MDIKSKLFLGMMLIRFIDAVEECDLGRVLLLNNVPNSHPVSKC